MPPRKRKKKAAAAKNEEGEEPVEAEAEAEEEEPAAKKQETEAGEAFLIADVSIKCGTAKHTSVLALSWVAVFLYPIGFTVCCAILLFKASPDIVAGNLTPLSLSTAFLHHEYGVTTYWWELLEMLRKFFLVGLFVILSPGTIMQISIATVVCATFLSLWQDVVSKPGAF